MAQSKLHRIENLFARGTIASGEVEIGRGDVEILRAQLDSLTDALREEQQLLKARLDAKKAELEEAEIQVQLELVRRPQQPRGPGDRTVEEADLAIMARRKVCDTRRAELAELTTRLRWVEVRLGQAEESKRDERAGDPGPPTSSSKRSNRPPAR